MDISYSNKIVLANFSKFDPVCKLPNLEKLTNQKNVLLCDSTETTMHYIIIFMSRPFYSWLIIRHESTTPIILSTAN
jgi:hypothetical protein